MNVLFSNRVLIASIIGKKLASLLRTPSHIQFCPGMEFSISRKKMLKIFVSHINFDPRWKDFFLLRLGWKLIAGTLWNPIKLAPGWNFASSRKCDNLLKFLDGTLRGVLLFSQASPMILEQLSQTLRPCMPLPYF